MPCYVERTGFSGSSRPVVSRPTPPPVVSRPTPPATPSRVSDREEPQASASRASASRKTMMSREESAAKKIEAALRLSETLLGVPNELRRPDATDAEVALSQGWARVAAKPINSGYANTRFPLETKRPDLASKYPESVRFDAQGFPDFAPYAVAHVKLSQLRESTSNSDSAAVSRARDFAAADQLSGWSNVARRDAGLTWHHVQDGMNLLLVPTDLHNAIAHHGGVAHEERVAGPHRLITNYVLQELRDV